MRSTKALVRLGAISHNLETAIRYAPGSKIMAVLKANAYGHGAVEVARALQINPSYLALGPIFATTSKIMPWIPQGVPAVKNWVGLLNKDYPLVAIGGINFVRAEALKLTGIGSIAMISEITKADDYKKATEDLLRLWST